MTSSPKFTKDCLTAFDEMNTQESPNDFFVAGLEDNMQVSLVEKGRGGMARVKEILLEQFASRTAVAVFRITAVDDRENTVSYRTKLVHVIYTGPKTPVMKRAKVGSYNAVFKEKFSCNMYIQTDDCEGDLNEQQLERNLRLSGGAHAPNRYDFTNSSAPGANEGARTVVNEQPASPQAKPPVAAAVAAPAAPAVVVKEVAAAPEVEVSAEEVVSHHVSLMQSRDLNGCMANYTNASQVILVDASAQTTSFCSGLSEIQVALEGLFARIGENELNVYSVIHEQVVSKIEYNCEGAGIAYGSDTVLVQKGKIALHTVVIVDA